MGTYNLYIPSSTGSYTKPYGAVRLRLYYDGSGSGNTNFDSPPEFADKLSFDFAIEPDGTLHLSTCKVQFWNKDNIWETHGGSGVFAQATDKDAIFLDIIIDGSVFWSGVIDYLNHEKKDYYNDDGDLIYQTIEIPFIDKIKYLEKITCAEAGISSGDTIASIIGAMVTELGLGSTTYTYENFSFTEISGRQFGVRSAMPQYSLKRANVDASENCLSLLKKLALDFGFKVYNYKNSLYIQDHDSSSFSALDVITDDSPIEKIPKKQPFKYVAVKGTKDWSELETAAGFTMNLPSDTRRFSVGDQSANSSQNFVLDLSDLANIYYDPYTDGNTWTPGDAVTGFTAADPTDRPSEIKIINPVLGNNYAQADWEAESGMIAELNHDSYSGDRFWSIVTHWASDATVFYCLSNGKTATDISATKICRVIRKKPGTWAAYDQLCKIYPCLKTVAAIYAKALMGEKSVRVRQKEFRHVYLGFSFEGDNYVITKMEYDLKNGGCEYEAEALTGAPTVSASDDVAAHMNTVDAVDDGTNKVTASQIHNHINDKTIHINHSYEGVSFLRMTADDGKTYFIYLRNVGGRILIDPSRTEPE